SRKSGIRIAPTSGERSIISRLEWELVELWLRPSLQSFDQSLCYYSFEALARFFNVHTPRPGAEWKAQEIRYQCRKLGLMRSERILFRDIQFLGMEGAMRLFRGVPMKGVVLRSNGNPKAPRSGTGGK